jgi:hypothetical protein
MIATSNARAIACAGVGGSDSVGARGSDGVSDGGGV